MPRTTSNRLWDDALSGLEIRPPEPVLSPQSLAQARMHWLYYPFADPSLFRISGGAW